MKKVLSFVLVLTLVLGSFSMAFAATPADVVGANCEAAVTALVDLGVVSGYTDGTYQPTKNVNRAEAAKLIIAALGLTDYAAGNKASFTDLDGYAWAEGYIGYAEALGILKGVGEGKYNPAGEVTYEQVATMIVRALGWSDEALPGTWPANYVVKAKALHIMDDINKVGSVPANRGDIAIMIYNALEVEMVRIDKDLFAQPTGDTMLNRLDSHQFYVQGATDPTTSAVGWITLSDNDSFAEGVNLQQYYGALVKCYANSDNQITGIKDCKTTFLTGTFNSAAAWASGTTFTTTDDVTYTFSTVPSPVCNIVNAVSQAALASPADTSTKYTIAVEITGKKITNLNSTSKWTATTNFVWDSANVKEVAKDYSSRANATIDGHKFDLDDNYKIDTAAFQLVGAASLADIPEDAVVTIYKKGNVTGNSVNRVEVSTETVTGTISRVNADGDYVINGTAYSAVTGLTPALGDEGTWTLTYGGKLYEFEGVEQMDNYAIINATGAAVTGTGYQPTTSYAIELVNAEGKVVEYTINKNAVITGTAITTATKASLLANADWNKLVPGEVVSYSLNSKGEISGMELETLTSATANTSLYTTKGLLDGYQVLSNVLVFKAGTDDYELGSLADVPKNETLVGTKLVLDGNNKVAVIFAGDAASDSVYGVVSTYDRVKDGDDYYYEVKMFVDGNEVTYNTSSDNLTYGQAIDVDEAFYEIGLSGGDIAVVTKTAIGTSTVAAIKDGNIKVSGNNYFTEIADDVVVYEAVYNTDDSFSKMVVSDLGSIGEEYVVLLMEVDGTNDEDGVDYIIYKAI